MEPFRSRWELWEKKSLYEAPPLTDKTDKTLIRTEKSSNGVGGRTDKTDETLSGGVRAVRPPRASLSVPKPAPLQCVPCLHQWTQAGRQATCTVCGLLVPVLPRDERALSERAIP
jgi:hypothetical protein